MLTVRDPGQESGTGRQPKHNKHLDTQRDIAYN